MADQLAPTVERLVTAINLRTIWEEMDAGTWAPPTEIPTEVNAA